jgi:hypothetical protein
MEFLLEIVLDIIEVDNTSTHLKFESTQRLKVSVDGERTCIGLFECYFFLFYNDNDDQRDNRDG